MPLGIILALALAGHTVGRLAVEVVRPDGGPLPLGLTVEARHHEDGRTVVSLGAPPALPLDEGPWVVQARAPGFWGEALEADVRRDSHPRKGLLKLRIFPARAVSVAAKGAPQSSEAPPAVLKELRLVFSTPPGAPVAVTRGEVTCDPGWRCTLPNLELDVQVRSAGFVPSYRWNLKCTVTRLDAIELRRGASISGFVHVRGRPGRHCDVSLQTADGGLIRGAVGSRSAGDVRATPGPRGFFQLTQMPPGHYLVSADCGAEGRAAVPARVDAGVESQIIRPLAPERGAELRLRVDPPVAPSGRRWFASIGSAEGAGTTLFSGQAGLDGTLRRPGVAAGRYRIRVSDATDRWSAQTFDFGPSTGEIRIEVPVEELHGQVFWGTTALKAKLALGGRFGERRIVAETDEEGRFGASVPEGLAAAGKWVVTVHSDEAGVDATLRGVESEGGFLKVVVPRTRVGGRVVGATSEDLGRLAVRLAREDSVQSITRFDADGAFEFLGVPAGEYALSGESVDKFAGPVPLVVEDEGDVSGVLLKLRRAESATVRVLTPEGTAVPGAVVGLVPKHAPELMGTQEVTDLEGEADFALLPDWGAVVVNVAARGYGFHVASYPRTKGRPILVRLRRSVAELAVKMDLPSPDIPVLLHRGGFIDVRALAGAWSQPTEPSFGHNLRELEPGSYRVCRVKSAEYGALLRSGFATARACIDVMLEPSRVETVELP